jgi:hypothetical protein
MPAVIVLQWIDDGRAASHMAGQAGGRWRFAGDAADLE